MAYVTSTATTPAHNAGILAGIANIGRTVAAELRKRRVYHRTLHELSALKDRELNDLGLNRGALRKIAYDAAYGV